MSRLAQAGLLLFLLAVTVVVMFVVQNGARTTQLSLNLGFLAMELAEPISVPALIGASFGVGFVVSALLFARRSMRLSATVADLQRQIAVGGGSASEWR